MEGRAAAESFSVGEVLVRVVGTQDADGTGHAVRDTAPRPTQNMHDDSLPNRRLVFLVYGDLALAPVERGGRLPCKGCGARGAVQR